MEGDLIGLLFFFSVISLKLIILSKNPKATANSKNWLAFLLLSWALGEGHCAWHEQGVLLPYGASIQMIVSAIRTPMDHAVINIVLLSVK